jgi:acetyl-CoA acetyltransferase
MRHQVELVGYRHEKAPYRMDLLAVIAEHSLFTFAPLQVASYVDAWERLHAQYSQPDAAPDATGRPRLPHRSPNRHGQ